MKGNLGDLRVEKWIREENFGVKMERETKLDIICLAQGYLGVFILFALCWIFSEVML